MPFGGLIDHTKEALPSFYSEPLEIWIRKEGCKTLDFGVNCKD